MTGAVLVRTKPFDPDHLLVPGLAPLDRLTYPDPFLFLSRGQMAVTLGATGYFMYLDLPLTRPSPRHRPFLFMLSPNHALTRSMAAAYKLSWHQPTPSLLASSSSMLPSAALGVRFLGSSHPKVRTFQCLGIYPDSHETDVSTSSPDICSYASRLPSEGRLALYGNELVRRLTSSSELFCHLGPHGTDKIAPSASRLLP